MILLFFIDFACSVVCSSNDCNSFSNSDSTCDADINSEICRILDNAMSCKVDDLDHFKEVLWSQKREIECCRRLIQRKDDVIKVMAGLLSTTGVIDEVGLMRIVSSCSCKSSNFGESVLSHGKF